MSKRQGGSAHVLDLRKAVVAGKHLHAANESEGLEQERTDADVARNRDKARRLARRNDAAAFDLQLNQRAFADVLRFADGLPPLAED